MVYRAAASDGGSHGVLGIDIQFPYIFVEIAEYGIIYIGIGDIGVDGAGGAVQQVAVIDVAAVDHHKGAGAGDGEIAEASGAQVQVGDGRAVVIDYDKVAVLQLLEQIVELPVGRVVIEGGRIGLVAPVSAAGYILHRVCDRAIRGRLYGTEAGHHHEDGDGS